MPNLLSQKALHTNQVSVHQLTRRLTFSMDNSQPAQESGSKAPGQGSTSAPSSFRKKPVVCLFMGMAGSGKTTLVQRLNLYMNEKVCIKAKRSTVAVALVIHCPLHLEHKVGLTFGLCII